MASDLEALFVATQHRLFRYFCRAVGHAESARDLTQEVFVRVSRSAIPAEDGDGSVKSEVQLTPAEIVDVQLPAFDNDAGPFARRQFSLRIRSPLLARRQLDRARSLTRLQDRHQIRKRQRRELTRQEVANVEHGLVLTDQDVELGVHLLRQRRS